MRNIKSYLWTAGVAAGLCLPSIAQADAPKISGFIDTTYNYDFNKPASRVTAMKSFDRRTDSFLLNAAQVNIEGSKDGIGYYTELAFGTDPSVYKSAGTGADAGLPGAPSTVAYNVEVQEAFLTYKCPKTGVMLKAGKFVTLQGIEVIESKDNFTITRGHLFGLAEPYTHVGALAGYAFPKYIEIWVGVVNGWDLHADNNYGKTFLGKVGFTLNDMISGLISVSQGAEKNNNTNDARTSVDTTWFIKPVKKLTLALQANAGGEDNTSIADRNGDGLPDGGQGHWYGLGVQPKYDINDKFFVGGRYEWFSDLDGARTGATHVHQNITISPGVNLSDSLLFRTEYRYNWASVSAYEGSDGLFSKNVSPSVSAEFIYKF